MPNLTATFKLVDEMSDKLNSVAESGQSMTNQLEQSGESASAVFNGISNSVTSTATSIDGVASSIDSYGTATEQAASQTDHWTDAVGNLDKSALEAVYTTEELVEMGLKSAAAMEEQEQMFAICEKSAAQLNNAMEQGVEIQSSLNSAMESSATVMSEIADNEKVSVETKQELSQASERAAEAMKELEAAQEEAAAAMEAYDSTMTSGTSDLETLEAAAERAGHAAESLAEANGKAKDATEELSTQTAKASDEAESGGQKSVDAIAGISSALAAAGITVAVKEISEAVYELVEAFSEAESIVVMATGATGEALDGLMISTMDAYAAAKNADLSSTAGAIGEINTRMGLTGDELTDVTGKFLDFASVTGGNATSSVRNITQLMNQWGVEASGLNGILDKLTYSGQVSGISVDSLSSQLINNKAVLDQLGFSLDEAIAMFSNFELAGTNASSIMTGFRTALSNGSISSLEELYDVFGQISSGAITAADASEMFGSRAGPAIVNAVNTGVLSLDEMVSALQNTDGTLSTTAEAAQTLDQKWTQASNNISTAFTSAVEPTLNKFSSVLAGLANDFGDFLNEHPKFTKFITAIGIGLGVVVTGITGVVFVSKVAIPAITALGGAFNAALGPIGWVSIAIAGVVAAGAALAAMLSDVEDETAGLTYASREQYYELQDLNAEYEEACEKYGETSEEASRLKYQVDDLSAAYEANRQTVEEMVTEYEEFAQKCDETISSYQDSVTEIHNQEVGTYALIQKLEDLAEQNEITAGTEEQMKAVIEALNEQLPDLGLSYEKVIGNVDGYVEAMKRAAKQQTEEKKRQEQIKTYSELLDQQAAAEDNLAKATENRNKVREEYERTREQLSQYYSEDELPSDSYEPSELKKSEEVVGGYEAELAGINKQIAEIENDWAAVGEATEEAAKHPASYKEAMTTTFSSVEEEVTNLITTYNKAYEAARSSIDGQIGLFEKMSLESETSTQEMQDALDSQAKYINDYTDNLKLAAEYGFDENLISSLSDGSQQSAEYLDTIIEKTKSLGGNTKEAKEFVKNFNEDFQKVEQAKDKFADTVGKIESDFDNAMTGIENRLNSAVQKMEMSAEAKTAAESTINAYIKAIKNLEGPAVEAADQVSNAVAKALKKTPTSVSVVPTDSSFVGPIPLDSTTDTGSTTGYASGTRNAEPGVKLVGEEGPELMVFGGGEVVYTAEETARILDNSGADNQSYRTNVPIAMQEDSPTVQAESPAPQEKKISLEINGQGSIGISNGVDKETVIDMLYNYLKPVLAEILQQEAYEEGDLSYDY